MKILFISYKKNSLTGERELYEQDLMIDVLGFDRSLLDLGLLTILARTPDDIEVSLQDEYLAEIDYDEDCDLVAISAKTSCAPAAYRIADEFRLRGKKVVLGGIHASLRPEEALEHVDYIVTGEAEDIWLDFLADFRKGEAQQRYDAKEFPSMDDIPHPEYAQLDPKKFLFHQIQTTRGCPYMCRFCSVPDISGRSFRFKPVEKVIEEIRGLPRRGRIAERMKALYIVDDNFLSRTKYTKELLEALIPLRKNGELPEWSAETTLNVATDEELLDLFAKAGCTTLIIGFESISQETLNSMNKGINFAISFKEAIDRIHARGMSIVGNFIVGFDTDTLEVFRNTRDFVLENNILYPFFSILTPMPGTELHEDYKREERLDHFDWSLYDTRHVVFEPTHMTREQLQDGYIWLYEQCFSSPKALKQLSDFWARPHLKASNLIERTFIKWRLAKSRLLTDSGRKFAKQGFDLRKKVGQMDVSQLLYYLDSAHFAETMAKFKSKDYSKHVALFEEYVHAEVKDSSQMQWEDKRILRKATSV